MILTVLIILFALVNTLAAGVENTTAKIDGDYYNTGESELSLTLMTEEGLDELSRFTRLKTLTIIPYKAAIINALNTDDPQIIESVKRETNETYPDCTDLEDISFLTNAPTIERLNISYCSVSDISCLTSMEKLTELNISYTNVSDLSPLSELDGITELILTGIPAEDLSPLLSMDSLTKVKMDQGKDESTAEALKEKEVEVELIGEAD